MDRTDPAVECAYVSMNSIPHIGVTKLFSKGSRPAHFDLADSSGEVTFVRALHVPATQVVEYVSVFRKGTTDARFDGYRRLDISGPFDLQWNLEAGIPFDIVGLNALTRAVHDRLDESN